VVLDVTFGTVKTTLSSPVFGVSNVTVHLSSGECTNHHTAVLCCGHLWAHKKFKFVKSAHLGA